MCIIHMFITGMLPGSRVATTLGTVLRALFPLLDSLRVELSHRKGPVSWVDWRKADRVEVLAELGEPISARVADNHHLSGGAGSVMLEGVEVLEEGLEEVEGVEGVEVL